MYLYKNKKLIAITLIELIIALCIAMILGLVSYSTLASLKKSYRRKEAQAELMKLKSNIQEQAIKHSCSVVGVGKWFQTGNNTECVGLPATSKPTTINTTNNYYVMSVTVNLDNSITLIATPVADGAQTKDFSCATIKLTSNMDMSEDVYGSTGSVPDDPECWK